MLHNLINHILSYVYFVSVMNNMGVSLFRVHIELRRVRGGGGQIYLQQSYN
jgi:hypothetical protein